MYENAGSFEKRVCMHAFSFSTFLNKSHHPGHPIFMRRIQNFMICGLTGWCMEILFTSTGSIWKHDRRMMGQTSLWMFPIYGMAAVIAPVSRRLTSCPVLLRGAIYSVGILTGEYVSGSFLKKHRMCPWDYSKAKANINGIIRLDYAPLWMFAGLAFEKILSIADPLTESG